MNDVWDVVNDIQAVLKKHNVKLQELDEVISCLSHQLHEHTAWEEDGTMAW